MLTVAKSTVYYYTPPNFMKNKVTICDLFSVGNSRVNELPEVGESRQVLWRRTRTGIRNWLLCVNPILEIIWHFFLKKIHKKRDERGSETGCYTSIRPRNYLALFPEKYTKKDTNWNMKLDVMR